MTSSSEAVVWEGFVALEIPIGWEWSEGDGTISVYDPGGVGALQMSFARRESSDRMLDLNRFTVELATELGVAPTPHCRRTNLGGLAASYLEGIAPGTDSRYWRIWHVGRDLRIARVTYTSAAGDKDVETSAIDGMMRTCRWLF